MALYDVIRKEKDDDNIIWRYPKNKFNTSSQLIVHEGQEAIFYSNGKALDLFGPGKYTLETNNIPLLKKLIGIPTGIKSAFQSEVYFIDKSEKTSKWGTSSKIEFLEPIYKFPIAIGACGEMRFIISDSRKFLLKLVGIKNNFDGSSIDDFFKSQILLKVKNYISEIITNDKICIFEIDRNLEKFSLELQKKLENDFDEFGIKLNKFFVTNIAKPEDDKRYLEFKELYFRKSVAVAEAELKQKLDLIEEDTKAKKVVIASEAEATKRSKEGYTYQEEQAFKVSEKVANNQAIGQYTNVGVGLGMMSGIGAPLSGEVSKQVTTAFTKIDGNSICPNCKTPNEPNTNFCKHCGFKLNKERSCPHCLAKVAEDAKFCSKCGERLD